MKMNYKLLEEADIVSFDIFDTLLKRNVPTPEDIFEVVGKIAGVSEFAVKRKEAAKIASQKSSNGEATIDEIYDCLDISSELDRERLKILELKTEKQYIQVNHDIRAVYDWCLKKKKKIIAVSDMYLSSFFLNELLMENGFQVEEVFVSCEERASKLSGELFRVVSYKMRSRNIVHIGDSLRSDYLSAFRAGWGALHYKKNKSGNSIIDCVIKNNYPKDYFKRLGYSVLGPLLFSFSVWLEGKTKEVDTLLFFSREGMIMKAAFEKLSNRSSSYVYVSRQSLITAVIWMHPEFDDLRNTIIITKTFSLSQFIRRVGLDPKDFDLAEYNLDYEKEYDCEEFWHDERVRDFYDFIRPQVIRNSHIQYSLFFKYISHYIVGTQIGVVDIGWKATMQFRFEELLKSNPKYADCTVHGFYYGVEKETPNVNGFLYKSKDQTEYKTAIDAGFGLIETFFLAREGSTLKYSEKGPVLDKYEVSSEEEIVKLKAIHRGGLEFVDKMVRLDACETVDTSPKDSFRYFEQLVYHPKRQDVCELGRLGFKDSENTTIILERGVMTYILSLKRLRQDYHMAPWKIGFLKKNLGRWIPWGEIYKKVKAIAYMRN